MNILISICARGGSKGVKNKNIRLLNGKPLIAYTIEQGIKWGRASHLVVSTDSDEIAKVSILHGAEVPFMRPEELARDDTPKIETIRHVLKECERIYGKIFDVIVDLDATAPIRSTADIENSFTKFIKSDALSLFSVVHAHRNPYFNMVEEGKDGYVQLCKSLPSGVYRRQDAPTVYDMNASIYVYRRSFLIDEKNRFPVSSQSLVYVMDDISAFDIDREVDFKFIEFLDREGIFKL